MKLRGEVFVEQPVVLEAVENLVVFAKLKQRRFEKVDSGRVYGLVLKL